MEHVRKQTHAHVRAVERYGREFNLAKVCRIVQSGRAKFVALGRDGCATFDVPYDENGTTTTVRVMMSADRTHVVTVVPPVASWEVAKARKAATADRRGKRNREYYKRFEDDEEEVVTVHR
jgi:hypothetical protein